MHVGQAGCRSRNLKQIHARGGPAVGPCGSWCRTGALEVVRAGMLVIWALTWTSQRIGFASSAADEIGCWFGVRKWACWKACCGLFGSYGPLGKRRMATGVRDVTCVQAAGEDHARELAIGPRKRRVLLGQAVAEKKGLVGLMAWACRPAEVLFGLSCY